jgi:hypothetical protein
MQRAGIIPGRRDIGFGGQQRYGKLSVYLDPGAGRKTVRQAKDRIVWPTAIGASTISMICANAWQRAAPAACCAGLA